LKPGAGLDLSQRDQDVVGRFYDNMIPNQRPLESPSGDADSANCRQWAMQLEKLGVENVRISLTESFYLEGVNRRFAWEWLRSHDRQRHAKDMRRQLWSLAACVGVAIAGIVVLFIGVFELDKPRFFCNWPPFTAVAVVRCDRPY